MPSLTSHSVAAAQKDVARACSILRKRRTASLTRSYSRSAGLRPLPVSLRSLKRITTSVSLNVREA
ncbi:hypothetical protein [Providencia heimbachae]|uniref:hypothetical protein n=1 Tax=Providencia heimbachae TaxID=333962 RepID=UPI002240898A|nr:hypothetical protein [Providencia heimbachae]